MRITTTVNTFFSPIGKAKMERSDNSWHWLECGETRAQVSRCPECLLVGMTSESIQTISVKIQKCTCPLGSSGAKNSSLRKQIRVQGKTPVKGIPIHSIVCCSKHWHQLHGITRDWLDKLRYPDNGMCKECSPSADLQSSPRYIVK